MEIISYDDNFREQMIDVWERSVRATHDFVTPDDFDYFKHIVKDIDFHLFSVYCLRSASRVVGFTGVVDKTIEMLFIDPDFFGQGLGKKLVKFALEDLGAEKVDVNEQNIRSVKFYSKFGFVTYERTDKDPQGKDYPILKMKLEKSNIKFIR